MGYTASRGRNKGHYLDFPLVRYVESRTAAWTGSYESAVSLV